MAEPVPAVVPEPEAVAAFIERILAGAQIASRARREDLRRELWAHFEDAGTSPEAVRRAMRQFGAEAMVTESLRRVYRWDYLVLYLAKLAASIVASIAVALLIQVLVNLPVERQADVWRLAPGFVHASGLSVGVILGLVTAWEVGRQPFNRSRALVAMGAYAAVCGFGQFVFTNNVSAFVTPTVLVVLGVWCTKLEPRPAKLLVAFGVFAAFLYGIHLTLSVAFGPGRALMRSAVLVAVWASTVLILARFDHAFVAVFETAKKRTA